MGHKFPSNGSASFPNCINVEYCLEVIAKYFLSCSEISSFLSTKPFTVNFIRAKPILQTKCRPESRLDQFSDTFLSNLFASSFCSGGSSFDRCNMGCDSGKMAGSCSARAGKLKLRRLRLEVRPSFKQGLLRPGFLTAERKWPQFLLK